MPDFSKSAYCIIVFFTLLSFVACKNKTSTSKKYNIRNPIYSVKNDNSQTEEQKVISKVEALPEVRQAESYIDSFSNHKHGIAFRIANDPGKDHYYLVQAGYNGDIRFETYFLFSVYVPGFEIKYFDVARDTAISLDVWRNDKSRLLTY